MTPDRQAELLARWLQQEPGTAPPPELDADAVEAVYALRPDLAPAPSLSIEDILAEVAEGPFAEVDWPAKDAASVAALVAWLEERPGARPPADADPDVIEAVYALRPDLAPAPDLDLDDILGAVTTGPFAAAAAAAAAQPADNLVALPTRRTPDRHRAQPPQRRRLPPWAIPAVGALAVAATALVLVLPSSQEAMQAPTPFDATETLSTRERTAATPAAAPPPAEPDTVRQAPKAEATARLEDSLDDAPAGGAAAAGEDADDVLIPVDPPPVAASGAARPATSAGSTAAGAPAPARRDTAAPAAQAAPAPAEKAKESPRNELAAAEEAQAWGGLDRTTETRALDDREEAEEEPASSYDEVGAEGALAVEEAQAERKKSQKRSASGSTAIFGGRGEGRAQAEAAAPSAPAAEPAADFTADAAPATTSSSTSSSTGGDSGAMSLDQLRAAAWPIGGVPDMTLGRPDVAAAHAAAVEADARGDQAGFLAALRPLLSHAELAVAQDAAWRIARRQLSLGMTGQALQTIDQALGRGGTGVLRARLYALQGQAYERQGDTERAAASYRAAIAAR